MMQEAILGILFFCGIVLLLTLFVLGARRLLVPRGECKIEINGRKTVTANIGERLLAVCQGAEYSCPAPVPGPVPVVCARSACCRAAARPVRRSSRN